MHQVFMHTLATRSTKMCPHNPQIFIPESAYSAKLAIAQQRKRLQMPSDNSTDTSQQEAEPSDLKKEDATTFCLTRWWGVLYRILPWKVGFA